MKMFLRNLILGRNKYIEDYSTYMRTMLHGYLVLLAIVITGFYLLLNTFHYDRTAGNVQYIMVMIFSVGTLYLTRLGYFTTAAILQILLVNAVVFYFSFYDYKDGNYLYFLSSALGSLVVLGYRQRRLAFIAVGISLVLFAVAYTGFFGYYPRDLRLHVFYNFVFVFAMCIMTLHYTLRLHHHSEKITYAKNLQLQKVNAELDRFVYSASHDLRAPLASLLGLIELAHKSNDKKEIENYLSMMKGRVHHLDDFIKEIIDYSRNERMEVVREPVNLHQLVEETTTNLKHLEGAEHIHIQNEVPVDLMVPSDAMRLKIVINNLMNNAIKYHDHNKASRYIKISANTSGFSIHDNGMGISAEHREKVFNMFYRASDKSKGSGLGLYIVKESLGQLGGSVSLKSELGEGSTFTIQLPA
jgi:signal transduction histidine kinase